MNKLTIEQLLFAHRIGASHRLYSVMPPYYKSGGSELPPLVYNQEESCWEEDKSRVPIDRMAWRGLEIDFTPLYDWIDHDGGECPVRPDDEVVVEFEMLHDGAPMFFSSADGVNWEDVERFRLYGTEDCPEQRSDAIDIPPPEYDPRDVAFRSVSDGSTASYYELPPEATELQHLISYRNMNAQDGEIFRAIYRKGRASHSDALRDAKKVLFYAQAEVERLEKYGK